MTTRSKYCKQNPANILAAKQVAQAAAATAEAVGLLVVGE